MKIWDLIPYLQESIPVEELKKTDSFVEELANEKITGAYYVMGENLTRHRKWLQKRACGMCR